LNSLFKVRTAIRRSSLVPSGIRTGLPPAFRSSVSPATAGTSARISAGQNTSPPAMHPAVMKNVPEMP
jgi:hypothetical protein